MKQQTWKPMGFGAVLAALSAFGLAPAAPAALAAALAALCCPGTYPPGTDE